MFNIAFFKGTKFGRKCTGLKSKEVVESINIHQEANYMPFRCMPRALLQRWVILNTAMLNERK